jgi:hypothetical protein
VLLSRDKISSKPFLRGIRKEAYFRSLFLEEVYAIKIGQESMPPHEIKPNVVWDFE